MPVKNILLLRHGHRIAWTLDPSTGKYTSSHPYPTRLPADPPLASHGVRQAHETAAYLSTLLGDEVRKDRLRIYSSLFYRCLETLRPTIQKLRDQHEANLKTLSASSLNVRGERGVGEWFGEAWFEQPGPAEAQRLKRDFFPWIDESYESRIVPDCHGEKIPELHDRVARALGQIVRDVDQEFVSMGRDDEEVTVLICGHAAPIICSGRALTGMMPDIPDEEDFKCYTCGVTKFVRRERVGDGTRRLLDMDVNEEDRGWRSNGGVAGGWDCVMNSYCGHLSQGEERGWHFHGDESFNSYGPESKAQPITSDGGLRKEVEDTNESPLATSKL